MRLLGGKPSICAQGWAVDCAVVCGGSGVGGSGGDGGVVVGGGGVCECV